MVAGAERLTAGRFEAMHSQFTRNVAVRQRLREWSKANQEEKSRHGRRRLYPVDELLPWSWRYRRAVVSYAARFGYADDFR